MVEVTITLADIGPAIQRYCQERLAQFLVNGFVSINEVRASEGLERFEWNPASFAEARARSEKLLREWLSPPQLAQYDAQRCFEVIGGDTGNRYRITSGLSYNIEQLDNAGEIICRWCFAPIGSLAFGDVMLAQKVALESNETAALKIANRKSGAGRLTMFNLSEIVGEGEDLFPGAYLLPGELARDMAPFFTGGIVRTDRPFGMTGEAGPEAVHPRSWMAQWGGLGQDLADQRRRDERRRAARPARR